jgi:hypothetical protein
VHFVVFHPADNAGINPARYGKTYLEQQIATRVQEFGLPPTAAFVRDWRAALETVQLWFVTWEDALAETGDGQLEQFYQLCQRFNR